MLLNHIPSNGSWFQFKICLQGNKNNHIPLEIRFTDFNGENGCLGGGLFFVLHGRGILHKQGIKLKFAPNTLFEKLMVISDLCKVQRM